MSMYALHMKRVTVLLRSSNERLIPMYTVRLITAAYKFKTRHSPSFAFYIFNLSKRVFLFFTSTRMRTTLGTRASCSIFVTAAVIPSISLPWAALRLRSCHLPDPSLSRRARGSA